MQIALIEQGLLTHQKKEKKRKEEKKKQHESEIMKNRGFAGRAIPQDGTCLTSTTLGSWWP